MNASDGRAADETNAALRAVLKSQLRAALRMLEQAVERCPDDLWLAAGPANPFWHVAYHACFYAHLYLQPRLEDFQPWEKHRDEYQYMGRIPTPPHRPPLIDQPYTRAEILEYLGVCVAMVDKTLDRIDLEAPSSGFWWYKMPKLEHLLVNLRHIQHHAAQLADRLRNHAGIGVEWASAR